MSLPGITVFKALRYVYTLRKLELIYDYPVGVLVAFFS